MWRNLICISNVARNVNSFSKLKPTELRKIKLSDIGGCSTMCTAEAAKTPEQNYTMLYKLKEIKTIAAICRIKSKFTVATISMIPIVSVLEYGNIINTYGTVTYAAFGLSISAMLSIFSIIFENTIGIIKCTKDEEKLMVSYIDFWGKRFDEIIPVSDWIPLSDIPEHRITSKFYLTTRYANSDVTRKLFLREQYIRKKENFNKLLGNY